MKVACFCFVLLVGLSARAQEASDSYNSGTVPRKGTASNGMCESASIKTLQVQDQDGLGTCYANQASLLIQNATGRTQPVSYQQVGMAHALLDAEKSVVNVTRVKDDGSKGLIMEGGYGCKAFRAAQEQGFCSSNTFNNFEHNGTADANKVQELVLNAMSAFIDGNAGSFAKFKDQDWQNIQKHLLGLIMLRKQQCLEPENTIREDQLSKRMALVLEKVASDVDKAVCANGKCKTGDVEMTQAQHDAWKARFTKFKTDFIQSVPAKSTSLSSQLRFNESYMQAMSVNYSKETTGNYSEAFYNVLNETNAKMGNLSPSLDKFITPNSFYDAEFETNAIIDSCQDRWAISDMLENLDLKGASVNPTCGDPSKFDQPTLQELQNLAAELTNALKSQSGGNLKQKLDSILGILAPGCQKQLAAGKDALKAMHCTYYSLNGDDGSHLGGKTVVKNLSKTSKTPEAIRAATDSAALNALCKGRVVGIDVCTGFMTTDEAVNTGFCEKPIAGIEGHSYHAMTVVGFRKTTNGKKQYLVQNSWGQSCNYESPATLPAGKVKKDIVCEKNADGTPTGRFWVGSDLLWNNTTNINIIDNESK